MRDEESVALWLAPIGIIIWLNLVLWGAYGIVKAVEGIF